MIRRYTKQNKLPIHPAKKSGAQTIGCMFCGGGAQYDNSGYRILRKTNPDAWRQFMVTWRGGEIILALKYDVTQATARQAILQLGGLDKLATERPWIFDFIRVNPMAGYDRGTRPIIEEAK
jgi:3'-phosphoadenosine 5'-phosphosulfate sulfotransferase (PAPS reductase)/FAD synthetase